MSMDKEALLHQPENPHPITSSWKSQRERSDFIARQTEAFLRAGGNIEQVPFGVVADIDNSQAAINARTWYLENPDAAPVQGDTRITEAMLQYANKRLAVKGGAQAPNMGQVAKELGVNEVALRKSIHKYRQRVSAKSGANASNRARKVDQ